MDKTAQDSLAKKPVDMRDRILEHLEALTSTVSLDDLVRLSTSDIAETLLISRSLASQYLNDLVRAGLVVKVAGRPVRYFHRRAFQKRFQVKLSASEYASLADLVQATGIADHRDFARAVGFDLSLSSVVEQCKAAVQYPPFGLPILLSGGVGVGKSFLSRLVYEYGKNQGLLPRDSSYVRIDCAGVPDAASFNGLLDESIVKSRGGVVFVNGIEALSPSAMEHCLASALGLDASQDAPRGRLVLSTTLSADNPKVSSAYSKLPICARVPSLKERTPEEREDLILSFLRGEGCRIGSDVKISRGAYRCLVNADFPDNIAGLRACVTNCCAKAFLNREGDYVVVRPYLLPSDLLSSAQIDQQPDDGVLIDASLDAIESEEGPVEQALDSLCSLDERFCAGELTVSELVSQAVSAVRGVEDHLIFGHGVNSSRSRAFERVVGTILADAGASYGIELSRKVAFLLAQEICLQLWPGIGLAKRKSACAERISHLLGAVTSELPFASSVSEQVAADVEGALGISLDHFTKTLLTLCVASESRDAKALRTLCVILSHGYSTATSIADAANRMLGMHVYEAVDMPYDQQLKDIVGPLQRLVDRHSYCTGVVFLVDMGSLEEAYKALENVTDSTIGVVNNVSTGLALEIGFGLLGGKSIAEVLGEATTACVTHCKVIERINREDAIVFCSESGVDAAERIRQLVSQSLPRTIGARLLTRPFKQLAANGSNDAVFSEHRVCAVIGTGDPRIASVPFVALEDIMSTASASKVDAVFGRWLDASELSSFHEKLLSNMTLQNVIRSITILDPERLFHEIESAVHELQRRTGEKIGSNAIIGLYVHLCCLVERLVTRNPIETYVGQDRFEEEHTDFIESFRQSFSSISTRYRVEVPVSEIAYVFDYISVSAAPAREERLGSPSLLLDE